jgi:hypothetical protein
MDALLSFFSDLILFTAGLAVVVLWIVLFIGIIIEVHDQIKEYRNKETEL